MLKTVAYLANLLFFAIFLYSVNRVADDAPQFLVVLLVLSTVALCVSFWHHTYGSEQS